MKDISLGTLPPFEYKMLRAALNYAVTFCATSAEGLERVGSDPGTDWSKEDRAHYEYWRGQASEMRAIRARFRKAGRV